jgi:hypothetical protein
MKTLAIILLLLSQPVWAFWYAEAGAGHNHSYNVKWKAEGRTGAYFQVGYTKELPEGWGVSVHWTHLSQYDAGAPFNDIPESAIDHTGISIRKEWR